jgi:hypothetical protein
MKRRIFYVLLFFIIFFSQAKGNNISASYNDTTKIKSQFLAYPIAFYLPETRWGFGAAGFYNFRFKNEKPTSNPSQVQFTFSLTQNRQVIMTIPFELYRSNNLWKFKGEISYYRYVYNFYGIGLSSKFDDKESFRANYPRFRIDILRRYKRFFAGFRFRVDNMQIEDKKVNGLLENGNYTGEDGGVISGIGLVGQLDTRDYIFNPTKGVFMETEIFANAKFTQSNFTYQRLSLDFAKYVRIKQDHTLAFHINTAMILGDPIFYDLLYFGSPKLMRGFQDRRFKDKNILVLQGEYRFPIYKWVQGVSFLSGGTVAASYSEIFENDYKISFGAGLRIVLNKKDRVRLRLDYGRTINEGGALYITINDAF